MPSLLSLPSSYRVPIYTIYMQAVLFSFLLPVAGLGEEEGRHVVVEEEACHRLISQIVSILPHTEERERIQALRSDQSLVLPMLVPCIPSSHFLLPGRKICLLTCTHTTHTALYQVDV